MQTKYDTCQGAHPIGVRRSTPNTWVEHGKIGRVERLPEGKPYVYGEATRNPRTAALVAQIKAEADR